MIGAVVIALVALALALALIWLLAMRDLPGAPNTTMHGGSSHTAKPRIKLIADRMEWMCARDGIQGFGLTPFDAYEQWRTRRAWFT